MKDQKTPTPSGSRRLLRLLLLMMITAATLFAAKTLYHLSGTVPELSELREIRQSRRSRVLSADGAVLGSYFHQNRSEVALEDVSPHMVDALLAIEDIRFYDHNGIDRRAMLRVLIRTLMLGQETGGGSTLTQQLAKNLFPRESGGWAALVAAKLREMITARRLERLYDKDEILELYLNTVSFGEETFGIETAALRFFSKQAGDLELHEAALLAGLLKAPGYYHPQRYPERALQRRDLVIHQMEKYGMLTDEEARHQREYPLSLIYQRTGISSGLATHFRERLRMDIQALLEKQPALDGQHYNLYSDGLTIRTTIDSRLQAAAEQALTEQVRQLQNNLDRQLDESHLLSDGDAVILREWQRTTHYSRLQNAGLSEAEIDSVFHTPQPMELFSWDGETEFMASPHDSLRHYLSLLHGSFIAMEPGSGDILAWVGGIDHNTSKFDHVVSRRQAGSAFKPLVYTAAREDGMKPCDYHRNQLRQYVEWEEWTPGNIDGDYGGYYSTQAALAQSVNTIAVDILMETGVGQVQEVAARLGIRSPVPAEPSIALGSAEVSLLELTGAYSVFANGGYRITPRYIETIHDARGRILYDFRSVNRPESPVISPDHAAVMVEMLERSVSTGTGRRLHSEFGLALPVAGKTGTSQHNRDGWFIGMTPDLVFGAWIGGQNQQVPFGDYIGTGSRTALPVTGRFLQLADSLNHPLVQARSFHPHQVNSLYPTDCADHRNESALDHLRNFFTGSRSDKPKRVESEESGRKSLGDRIRGLFGRD